MYRPKVVTRYARDIIKQGWYYKELVRYFRGEKIGHFVLGNYMEYNVIGGKGCNELQLTRMGWDG